MYSHPYTQAEYNQIDKHIDGLMEAMDNLNEKNDLLYEQAEALLHKIVLTKKGREMAERGQQKLDL